MDDRVYVFLADGFEEIEGLTVVDILRRADVDVRTVSVTGEKAVHGSHGITVLADELFDEMDAGAGTLFVLPGGMPGTKKLGAHEGLRALLVRAKAEGKRIAAICAAPTVLGDLGLLEGEEAVCYPGMEERLAGARIGKAEVVVSGLITTSRGMGTAIPFALSLLETLRGAGRAGAMAEKIVFRA